MPQHPADGFNRHSGFQRNQRGDQRFETYSLTDKNITTMRSTFSILPYINRSKVKADGTTAVLCRITIDGKSSTMATGIYCRPEDWNNKTGVIRTVRENNRLQEFRKSVELAYEDSLKKQNVVSAEILKNALARKAVIPAKLLQMGERELERLLVRSKEINSTSTYRNSKYYQKYLKDYLTSLGKEYLVVHSEVHQLAQPAQALVHL